MDGMAVRKVPGLALVSGSVQPMAVVSEPDKERSNQYPSI